MVDFGYDKPMTADDHRREARRHVEAQSLDPELLRLNIERAKVHALLAVEARLEGVATLLERMDDRAVQQSNYPRQVEVVERR